MLIFIFIGEIGEWVIGGGSLQARRSKALITGLNYTVVLPTGLKWGRGCSELKLRGKNKGLKLSSS